MNLIKEAERLIAVLSSCPSLEECRILKAFPYEKYPARLKHPVIAVATGELECEGRDLDLTVYSGEYTLNADIYIPQELGSPVAGEMLKHVVDSVATLCPYKIQVSKIIQYDMLNSFCIKCSFTFRGAMSFKEDNDD